MLYCTTVDSQEFTYIFNFLLGLWIFKNNYVNLFLYKLFLFWEYRRLTDLKLRLKTPENSTSIGELEESSITKNEKIEQKVAWSFWERFSHTTREKKIEIGEKLKKVINIYNIFTLPPRRAADHTLISSLPGIAEQ